eukprot:jgi/Psemu1/294371/fgenesh1_pm.18_\
MSFPTEVILSIILSVVVTLALLWLFYPAWAALVAERLEWDVEEMTAPDRQSLESPLLSLIIPAYNEQDRIPIMICETFDYLTSQRGEKLLRQLQSCSEQKTTCSLDDEIKDNAFSSKEKLQQGGSIPKVEWIIVNDGSTDATCDVVRETYKQLMAGKDGGDGEGISLASSVCDWKWKLVSLKRNAGKGGAVKTGMNLAEGMFQLMVDADGATEFGHGLENLTRELVAHPQNGEIRGDNSDPMIAIFGSRAHLEKESSAQRSFVRTVLMKAFHFFNAIFQNLHLRRWAFDTEIVLLCDTQAIDMIEVAYLELALAIVSISMLRDMICVRSCYTLGIWRINMGYQRKDKKTI